MKVKTILIITFFAFIYGQPEDCSDGRYINEIFDVSIDYGIEYGENTNQALFGQDITETLYMDIYSPSDDDFNSRPLIFFMFGGSFIGGSRLSPDIVALCTKYAQRGYVAVAIDYRLTPMLIFNANEETAYKAVLKAMHDVKAAIRYFRMMDESSPELYHVDPNRIFVGGVSAGAIAAVNVGYLNYIEEIPSFLMDEYDSLGGLEGNSGNEGYDSSFHGIVNLCGAVGDASWIEEGDIPIVSMHGDPDGTGPYSDNSVTLFGLDVQVYGSYLINETMNYLGNYSSLYTYVGEAHVPFTNNMNFEIEFIADFLYEIVCENPTGDINEDDLINILDVIVLINLVLSGEYQNNGDLNVDPHHNKIY